jgi:hypothetical protein
MSLTDPFNGQESPCLACGTVQPMKNGIARGACAHCRVGYLQGWHVNPQRATCRYKGCGQKAIAEDGKWPVCKTHLARRRPDLVCAAA